MLLLPLWAVRLVQSLSACTRVYFTFTNMCLYTLYVRHAVAQLVEALRYKPEGRGFDFRWCH